MNNKKWAVANLKGKTLNRAIRAIEEQNDWPWREFCTKIYFMFNWEESQEGNEYWTKVYEKDSKADKFLPSNYVEAPKYTPQIQVKDEFSDWLEQEIYTHQLPTETFWALKKVYKKYNQLKNQTA